MEGTRFPTIGKCCRRVGLVRNGLLPPFREESDVFDADTKCLHEMSWVRLIHCCCTECLKLSFFSHETALGALKRANDSGSP